MPVCAAATLDLPPTPEVLDSASKRGPGRAAALPLSALSLLSGGGCPRGAHEFMSWGCKSLPPSSRAPWCVDACRTLVSNDFCWHPRLVRVRMSR